MNKTVTTNLSGIIFHVDEDAYQKLNSYLNTIRGYFSESDGRDEIMADIENRIAEMLSEKISDRRQVVLMGDVDHVIGVMGKPEDFAGDKSQKEERAGEHGHSSTGRRRRVFRDTDHKIIGGVCSGIASYFNFDPLWLRLALAISFFIFGTGFLLYCVLWILIPEAKTTAEKLEMRGEDVNFSNIGRKVEEELKHFGKKAESWGEEVKQTVHQHRNLGDKIVDFLGTVFGTLFRVLGKLLGIFFVVLGMFLLVGIFSSIVTRTGIIHLEGQSHSFYDLLHTFFDGDQITMASIAIVLGLGIPIIMLVYGGVKMLLGIKGSNRIVNISALSLWLIGVVLAVTLGIGAAEQFSEGAESKQEFALTKTKCDTLFLKVKQVEGWNHGSRNRRRHYRASFENKSLFRSDSTNIYLGYPTLDIVKSESGNTEIIVYTNSRGADKKEALHFAQNISYEIFQQDSLVEIMPYFSIPKNEKWRNQQVHVEVRLPKGKIVYLGKNMGDVLDDIHNESNTYDGEMVSRRWEMGAEELKCLDCTGLDLERGRKPRRHLVIRDSFAGVDIEIPEAPMPPAGHDKYDHK